MPSGADSSNNISSSSSVTQPAGDEAATNMSEQLVQGMHHRPRTKFIAKVLRARRRVLRLHNMPQDAIPTNEMMDEIVNSLSIRFGPPLLSFKFWEAIRTNQIYAEDRENVKRYEDEQAVITSMIIHLGLCIATAWARSKASTRSRWTRRHAAVMEIL